MEISEPPLVGPPRRRGWRDILRLRPLTDNPHMALVVTRQGHLVSVIPAGSRRVLSDYLDRPCELREVDMRQRRLSIERALESRDAGRSFTATLAISYQVSHPERVALEVADPLGELGEALVQSARLVARTLWIEQTELLKQSLQELFAPDGTITQRSAALGVAIRHVDVSVSLAPADQSFALALRERQREQPILWSFIVESLDPRTSFEALVGGAYRLRSRRLAAGPDELEFSLREAIGRTLRRISVLYPPHEFRLAAAALAEALRGDPLLHAELAAAEIELLRPSVEIQPARPMLAEVMRAKLLPGPLDAAVAPSLPAPEADATGDRPTEPPATLPARRAPVDATQIERWVRLLQSDDPEDFARWSAELRGSPERLPAILSGLIRDPALLAHADEPAYQEALAAALVSDPEEPAIPGWLSDFGNAGQGEQPAPPAESRPALPDWLRLP